MKRNKTIDNLFKRDSIQKQECHLNSSLWNNPKMILDNWKTELKTIDYSNAQRLRGNKNNKENKDLYKLKELFMKMDKDKENKTIFIEKFNNAYIKSSIFQENSGERFHTPTKNGKNTIKMIDKDTMTVPANKTISKFYNNSRNKNNKLILPITSLNKQIFQVSKSNNQLINLKTKFDSTKSIIYFKRDESLKNLIISGSKLKL